MASSAVTTRITSYNVCYTKLLRTERGRHLLGIDPAEPEDDERQRDAECAEQDGKVHRPDVGHVIQVRLVGILVATGLRSVCRLV